MEPYFLYFFIEIPLVETIKIESNIVFGFFFLLFFFFEVLGPKKSKNKPKMWFSKYYYDKLLCGIFLISSREDTIAFKKD